MTLRHTHIFSVEIRSHGRWSMVHGGGLSNGYMVRSPGLGSNDAQLGFHKWLTWDWTIRCSGCSTGSITGLQPHRVLSCCEYWSGSGPSRLFMAFFQDEFRNRCCFVTCAKWENSSPFNVSWSLRSVFRHWPHELLDGNLLFMLGAGGISYGCYPPVIKHGVLENCPFISDFPITCNLHW